MARKKTPGKKSVRVKSESPSRKYDRQAWWVIIGMIGIVVVFILASAFFSGANKFKYEGINFEKIKYGDLTLFHSRYPLKSENGTIEYYNMFLREDPRRNEVPTYIQDIVFPQGKYTYISINSTGLIDCDDSGIAIAGLSQFLTLNGIRVKGAVPDENQSNLDNVEYATCGYPPERTVIIIQKGDETKIEQSGLCYVISVGKCEDVLKATEKFEIKALIDARARAGI